jgi:hypothetical protein
MKNGPTHDASQCLPRLVKLSVHPTSALDRRTSKIPAEPSGTSRTAYFRAAAMLFISNHPYSLTHNTHEYVNAVTSMVVTCVLITNQFWRQMNKESYISATIWPKAWAMSRKPIGKKIC